MIKKYLILTASYWSGHNAAKSAIKNYLEEKWDIVEVIDMVELLKKWWENSSKFYNLSQKIPILWDAAFNILDTEITNELLNLIFKSIYQKSFNCLIQKFNPDYVICTFPNWPIFLKNYLSKQEKTFRIWVIVTDAIEIWMPWFYWKEIVDEFFVIDKWTKEVFNQKFNHEFQNVNVSFFPIEEKYFTDKNEINNKKIWFLLTGLKKNFMDKILLNLENETFYEKVIICWGRNKKLFNQLKKTYLNYRFEYLDFPNLKELLKEIDIFVAKPGWAMICECIANDVPLISPSFIPGQEEWNIKLMEKSRVGFFVENPNNVLRIIKNSDFSEMINNFRDLKNKNSIKYIIDTLTSK